MDMDEDYICGICGEPFFLEKGRNGYHENVGVLLCCVCWDFEQGEIEALALLD